MGVTYLRNKMKNTIHNYDVPAIIVDAESIQILDVNAATIQVYGYTREELISKPAFMLVDKKDFENSFRTAEQFKGDDMYMGESEHATKSGIKIKVKIIAKRTVFQGLPAFFVILRND